MQEIVPFAYIDNQPKVMNIIIQNCREWTEYGEKNVKKRSKFKMNEKNGKNVQKYIKKGQLKVCFF